MMMHKEGDTPTNSESDLGESDWSEECELECTISKILQRRVVDGYIEYEVEVIGSPVPEWFDRSDLWDDGVNSTKLKEYDRLHPITWDIECALCGDPFVRSALGCEECRCDQCGRMCRHLNGINYGCERHPVV